MMSPISVRILAPVLTPIPGIDYQDRRRRVACEDHLDLGGEPVAAFGEPVELLGELSDHPACGFLRGDGDGLGLERGLDLFDEPAAEPGCVALRELG